MSISAQTNDVGKVGTYSVYYKVGLTSGTAETSFQLGFTLTILDRCSASFLTISSVAPTSIPPYYYDGQTYTLDTSAVFTSGDSNCAI